VRWPGCDGAVGSAPFQVGRRADAFRTLDDDVVIAERIIQGDREVHDRTMGLVALERVDGGADRRKQRWELHGHVVVRIAADALRPVPAEQLIPAAEVEPAGRREELDVDLGVVREIGDGRLVGVEAGYQEKTPRSVHRIRRRWPHFAVRIAPTRG